MPRTRPYKQSMRSRQQCHRLDVVSPGEHVYGLYFDGLVSVLFQVGQVAGQGGRIARDVDDACWFAPGNGLEDRFATAGPGRVEDDDAGADAFPDEFRQFIDGIAEDKLCIPYVIVPGIADGIADGRGDDFDAVDLFCFLGQEQCNGPGATVDVGNGFLSFQVSKSQCLFVKPLGLFAVDLEEGLGRNMEGQRPDGIVNRIFAIYGAGPGPQYDVGMTGIDILDDAGQSRYFTAQALYQVFHVRHHIAGRYQADHDFPRMDADAAHDVAYDACPGIFIVSWYLEVFHPLTDHADNDVVVFFLDGAIGHIDDFVSGSGKAADGDLSPAGCRNGKLHFIAIVPG